MSVSLGIPILLLTTIGARSGRRRSTPLLYIIDSDQFAVIASRGGSAHHPAWYLNLRANPQVTVLARGREMDCAARDAAGEERERLWQLALKAFEGYQVYRQRAGDREIPVVVLTPRPSF